MTDRPIIFSSSMISAILREIEQPGTGKRQTRRLAWRRAHLREYDFASEQLEDFDARGWNVRHVDHGYIEVAKPTAWQKVKPGDRLWVRENIGRQPVKSLLTGEPLGDMEEAIYAVDGAEVVNEHEFNLVPWWNSAGTLPCIHMPRIASRITLTVEAIKIEPLQSISEADALAEGVIWDRSAIPHAYWIDGLRAETFTDYSAVQTFKYLWKHINGPDSWDVNPSMVCCTFTPTLANIDRMPPCSPPTASQPPAS